MKCVTFCGRIQAQCVSVEITSDGIARNFCSLFSIYFSPMKVGEEKSHSRELKSLHDVLGCFYPLSMRASFSSFHSSNFVNLLLSFQDFKKRPQKNHWSWQQPLEITLLAPQSFSSGSCHQQLPDQLSPAVVLAADHWHHCSTPWEPGPLNMRVPPILWRRPHLLLSILLHASPP